MIEVDEKKAGLSRDQLLEVLSAERVDARRYFYPGIHNMEPYRSMWPDAAHSLPHTERLLQRVLALPTGTAVTPEQVALTTGLIRRAVGLADLIRAEVTRFALPLAGTA